MWTPGVKWLMIDLFDAYFLTFLVEVIPETKFVSLFNWDSLNTKLNSYYKEGV